MVTSITVSVQKLCEVEMPLFHHNVTDESVQALSTLLNVLLDVCV